MIQELIGQVTSQLGMDEGGAQNAVGSLMGFVKDQAGDEVFSKLEGAIPGVSDLASNTGEGESSGGLMGGLMGAASSMLGDKLGGAAGLVGALTNTGLEGDQMGSFVGIVTNFIKDKAGDGIFASLLDAVPEVKNFID